MEVTDFINLPVYTNRGRYVGEVKNVILDIEKKHVSKLVLTDTNRQLIEGGANIAVPYRWVSAVGDIMILCFFPEKVNKSAEEHHEEPIGEGS